MSSSRTRTRREAKIRAAERALQTIPERDTYTDAIETSTIRSDSMDPTHTTSPPERRLSHSLGSSTSRKVRLEEAREKYGRVTAAPNVSSTQTPVAAPNLPAAHAYHGVAPVDVPDLPAVPTPVSVTPAPVEAPDLPAAHPHHSVALVEFGAGWFDEPKPYASTSEHSLSDPPRRTICAGVRRFLDPESRKAFTNGAIKLPARLKVKVESWGKKKSALRRAPDGNSSSTGPIRTTDAPRSAPLGTSRFSKPESFSPPLLEDIQDTSTQPTNETHAPSLYATWPPFSSHDILRAHPGEPFHVTALKVQQRFQEVDDTTAKRLRAEFARKHRRSALITTLTSRDDRDIHRPSLAATLPRGHRMPSLHEYMAEATGFVDDEQVLSAGDIAVAVLDSPNDSEDCPLRNETSPTVSWATTAETSPE
jgi:hypothetical protein